MSDPVDTARYEALNLVDTPVWIFDIDRRRVRWANGPALAVWNATDLTELCERDLGADMSESVSRRLAQYQSDFIAHAAVFNEQWTLYPAGRPVCLNVRMRGHRLDDGRMAMLCQAQPANGSEPDSLRSVEALLHTAVMITLYRLDGTPLYRNPAARDSVQDPAETWRDRFVDSHAHALMLDQLHDAGLATQTLPVRTARGTAWHEISARRCRDAVTGADAVLVSEVDVSAIKHTEARAQHQAMHDALTGLPNRGHVMRRFAESLAAVRQEGGEAALVFIDLDHFKDINDTLGHASGDALLIEVSRRLRASVRRTDLVARLGGDEFLILMLGVSVCDEIERIRASLMQRIAEPMVLPGTLGQEVRVTPSVGVSLFPRDGEDFDTLLRHADLAMYTAKERGRNELAYYDRRMSEVVRNRTALEAELRRALDRGEFEVFYQPIVDVATGAIVGAESLARWRHPQRGLVPPDVFIPVCENTGQIHPLGARIFAIAARQQAAWSRAGFDLQVTVNLSVRQLRQPGLVEALLGELRSAGGDPQRLQLEITESMLLGKDEAMLAVLRDVRGAGLSIALDDFGTGYSNLAYLQRFPIHTLKIDKTFIQSIDANRSVAEMIVSMCRLLDLRVVAEGVETPEQLAWVRARGIASWQGYLCSPPVPAADFEALLRQPQTDAPWHPRSTGAETAPTGRRTHGGEIAAV